MQPDHLRPWRLSPASMFPGCIYAIAKILIRVAKKKELTSQGSKRSHFSQDHNQSELEMFGKFRIRTLLGIEFSTKSFAWALLAIALIDASCCYATMEKLAKDNLDQAQLQQTEPAPNSSKNDNISEERILRAVEGAKAIKQVMRDPNSFQLEMMNLMPSGAVCYAYQSRNEAGKMHQNIAVLIKNEIKTDEMQGFEQQWLEECHEKEGKDVTGFGKLMIY